MRDSKNVPYRTVQHFRTIKKINKEYDKAVETEQATEKAYDKFLKDKAEDLIEVHKAMAELARALADFVSSLR